MSLRFDILHKLITQPNLNLITISNIIKQSLLYSNSDPVTQIS